MTLHLVKLAVGVEDLKHLAAVEKQRKRERGRYGFFTRNMPKRVDDLLDGGSIYWVMKGQIRARQLLKRFHPQQDEEGRSYVIVEFAPKIVAVVPRRMRPFQGWRYLEPKSAPPDLPPGSENIDAPPEAMAAELRALGLL